MSEGRSPVFPAPPRLYGRWLIGPQINDVIEYDEDDGFLGVVVEGHCPGCIDDGKTETGFVRIIEDERGRWAVCREDYAWLVTYEPIRAHGRISEAKVPF